MTITELSIKRPAFITIVFVALSVLGILSYASLGTDLLPKMDWPFITVLTTYPGAGPEEVEDLISKPIEEAIAGTNKLDNVRSISNEGYSIVMGQYLLDAKTDDAAIDVQRRIEQIKSKLPKDANEPRILKNDISAMPVIRLAMTSSALTSTEAYQFAKDKLKPRFEAIEGVGTVEVTGGRKREIRIAVDNDKLRAYNLSILQISQALQAENLDFPTGTIKQPQDQFVVRVKGKFANLDEIKTLPVSRTQTGSVVYLGDVATVSDTYSEDMQPTRLNDQDAIGLLIVKQSDANATEVADRIYAMLSKLEKEYATDGISFKIAQDATRFTRASISEVFRDLMIAILLVSLVLFLFLKSGRNALIVLISIPTSLIATGIAMYLFGFTLNMMSLMALALVIGILVDDSIVVLENIHHKLDDGMSPVKAAIAGRNEIGFAALAITLVDVVVFLPMSLVGGIAGKIFREFGITVVVSTLMSLFVSFTLTPLLASRFGKAHEEIGFKPMRWLSNKFEAFQDWLTEKYRSVLAWSLEHRWVIVTTSFTMFFASCGLVFSGQIGGEFITAPDRGEFAVNFDFPPGTNIQTSDSLIRRFEHEIAKDSNVERYLTIVGKQEDAWMIKERPSVGQIQVKLVEPKRRTVSSMVAMRRIKEASLKFPGLMVRTEPIGIFGSANQAPVQIEVRGNNMSELSAYADSVIKIAKGVEGLKNLKSSYEEGQPEVKIVFDRERLSAYGMTVGEAAMSIRAALAGNTDAKYKEGETEYDINVIFDRLNRSNANDVADVSLMNRMGQLFKVADVATIFYGKGPAQITRKNRERVVTVTAGLEGRPLGGVVEELTQKFASVPRPKSVTEPYFAGDAENQNKSNNDMGIAFILAILFVYMIMVALFESYAHPLTIMFSLPVAVIGALVMLWLTGKTLSLFTFVGIIMLMGLVTKNAILIVDRTNDRRSVGMGVKEALLEAGPTRLRPIIMTTVTMILGMTPLALGLGEGAEFRQGMSIAIIGGLTSSMLLTLLLVPVMYTFMEGARVKFPRFFKRINIFARFRKPRPIYAEPLEANS